MKDSFKEVLKEFYLKAEQEFNEKGFSSNKVPVGDKNITYTLSYNKFGEGFDIHIKIRRKILDAYWGQVKKELK